MNRRWLVWFLVAGALLSACQGNSEKSGGKGVNPTFAPGQANVSGTIVSAKDGAPLAHVSVHLAEVHRQGESGAFLYDTSNSPSAVTNEHGEFTFSAVPAGEYVIVVGSSSIIAGADEKAAVFAVYADQDLDAGNLKSEYIP